MTRITAPAPIEPGSGFTPFAPVDSELADIGALAVGCRLLVAGFSLVVGVIVGGLGLLVAALEHWLARLVAFVALEPLALFLLCLSLYCLIPASTLGRLMALAYGRAKIAIWVIMAAAALATVIGLIWFAAIRLYG